MRGAVGVSPVVVHPEVEPGFHHDKGTERKTGFGGPMASSRLSTPARTTMTVSARRLLAPQQERLHRLSSTASAWPRATATASSAASTAWAYTRSVMAGLA